MRRMVLLSVGMAVAAFTSVAMAVPPTLPPGHSGVVWTHEFNFDNGPQGWTINNGAGLPPGAARWINPAIEPNGPILPDGNPSGSSGLLGNAQGGGGGGSIYLPDKSTATMLTQTLLGVQCATSFTMMVDVYVPNLRPLTGFGLLPGNHFQTAGLSGRDMENKELVLEAKGGSNDAYMRFRDFNGRYGNVWTFPTVGINPVQHLQELWVNMGAPTGACATLLNPDAWWDDWVTIFVDVNRTTTRKAYAWLYIPWTSPNPNCGFVATNPPGWYKIAEKDFDTFFSNDMCYKLFRIGGEFSWTQSQFDNVKLSLPAACNNPYADFDGDGDVDVTDFGIWQYCYTKAGDPANQFNPQQCTCVDRDGDSDVDEADFASFNACFSGPAVPANTMCDGAP